MGWALKMAAGVATVMFMCGTVLGKPKPGGVVDSKENKDPYAEVVEKAMGREHVDIAGIEEGEDAYQGRHHYGEVDESREEPALTAEEELLYADQRPPDWEEYHENEAEGQLRDQDFDEEYKRYLDEMRAEMASNPAVAVDIVKSLQQIEAEGGELDAREAAALNLALRFQHHTRSRLDEQEREILNRQRRERKHEMHREEGLGPEGAKQFGFHDPGDSFWNEDELSEKSHIRLKEIVKNRAKLLHNVDSRRKEAFLQHEMERLIEYRELVQRTADPKIRKALIAAHATEQAALSEAHAAEPGKEEELKKLWTDLGFEAEAFDPKTMFQLSDTNGDGALDEKEIEAMHETVAEQLHARSHGEEIDVEAIAEEAARMREHMMNFMDKNNDRLISLDEFLTASKSDSFKENKEWTAVNPEIEAKEKLKEFEHHRREVFQTGHKQADPALMKVAEKALAGVAKAHETLQKAKKKIPFKNPFGKLVDKVGGENSPWGKIAKNFGKKPMRKKRPDTTVKAIQFKKDA